MIHEMLIEGEETNVEISVVDDKFRIDMYHRPSREYFDITLTCDELDTLGLLLVKASQEHWHE